jgi:hypothetical protein
MSGCAFQAIKDVCFVFLIHCLLSILPQRGWGSLI